MMQAGILKGGAMLEPTRSATTVRQRGGKRLITEGPFVENAEQICGAGEIEVKDLSDRYVATVRVTTTPDKMGATFGEVLPEVDAEIVNAGTRPEGFPSALATTPRNGMR